MIRVITGESEFGSAGGVIVAKLATRLGSTLWDQLLTDEIAQRMDCGPRSVAESEEPADPRYYQLLKDFLRGSFEGSVNLPRLRLVEAQCVHAMVYQMLVEVGDTATAAMVLRAPAFYVANLENGYHVFIYGSLRNRVKARRKPARKNGEAAPEPAPPARHSISRYFGLQWPCRQLFHLMVNSVTCVDGAVEETLGAARLAECGA
jgi:hypothetical protein